MNKFLFVFISLCIFGQQVQSASKLLNSNINQLNGDLHPKHRHLSEEGQLNLKIAGRGYFQFRLPITLTDASDDPSQKRRLDGSCLAAGASVASRDYIHECCSNYAFMSTGIYNAGNDGRTLYRFCATTSRPSVEEENKCFTVDGGLNAKQCSTTKLSCNGILKLDATTSATSNLFKNCDCACSDKKQPWSRYESSKYYALAHNKNHNKGYENNVQQWSPAQDQKSLLLARFALDDWYRNIAGSFPNPNSEATSSDCSANQFGWYSWVKNALILNKERAEGSGTVVSTKLGTVACIDPLSVSATGTTRVLGTQDGGACNPKQSCYKEDGTTLVDGYDADHTSCRERCAGTVKFSDCPADVVEGTKDSDNGNAPYSATCPLSTVNSGYDFADNREKDGIFYVNQVSPTGQEGNYQLIYDSKTATTMVGDERKATSTITNTDIFPDYKQCCTIEICDINGENCFNQQPEAPAAAAETPKQCNNNCPTCADANSCIESPNSCNWKPIDDTTGDCVAAATYDEAYAASPPPNNTQGVGGLPDKGDGTNSVEATDDGDGDDKTISEVVYGKDGSLHVNKFGYLVDDNGFLLVSESRNTNDVNARFHIHIPSRADDLIVTPTGKILAMELGGGSITKVGQLKIVRFENAQGLNVRLKMKSNCYAAGESGFNLGNWCQGSDLDGKDHTYMSETLVSGPGIVGNPGDQGFGRILKSK